jgi:hypothetical protein
MINHPIRRAALLVALPAFVAAATAGPAFAGGSDDDKKDKVHVVICKEVKNSHKDKDDKKDKTKFSVEAWTDTSSKDVKKIKDGQCKDFDLEYKHKKKVWVKEDYAKGYEVDKVKCYDKYGHDSKADYNDKYKTYSCSFDKDWVKIVIINKKKDKH